MRWGPSSPARKRIRLRLLRRAARALQPLVLSSTASTQRVLLIRPDHIGDVLLGAEAVALLRASLPAARLTYLVGPWSAEAARHGPAVDEVRELAFPGFTRARNATIATPYATLLREAARLRRERFALALILRPDHWWGALLTLTAGIPLRVGSATSETTPLLTHAYVAPAGQPAGEHALAVARLAVRTTGAEPTNAPGAAAFGISPDARAAAAKIWRAHHLDGRRVVAIHPSAGAPLKSWPIDRWAQVADALAQQGLAVVLVGGPADGRLLETIRTRLTQVAPVVCGQSLEISAAVYARCELVISVDNGGGHLAGAVGTPTVRIYGPAPPTVFGPWPRRSNQRVLIANELACVSCGDLDSPPCGAHSMPACMLAVGVEDVLKATRAELDLS